MLSLIFAYENYYIIKKGDNLYRIAKKYNVPLDILLKANNGLDPTSIKVGTKILIPIIHIVKKGETLYSISRKYGVSVQAIMDLNSISSAQSLKLNQKIYISASSSIASGEPTESGNTNEELFWPHKGPRERYDGKIKGVLIKGKQGDVIYSASSGTVILSGPYRGFGYVIFIDASDNLIFGYLGNESNIVQVGDKVERGEAIARLGNSFQQNEPKLLFIIFNNKKRIYLDAVHVLEKIK